MRLRVAGSPRSQASAELARLLAPGSLSRHLLRRRVELFVGIGAALGLLHLAAGGHHSGGSLALSATLGALVPVYAPLCFVPVVMGERQRGAAPPGVVMGERQRGAAPPGVVMARVGVATALGWVVAAVHLGVWAALSSGGGIAGPSAYDIPFMVVTVAVTASLTSLAYQLPRRAGWAAPATVLTGVVAYVGAFVVHGDLLQPSLRRLRDHLGALPVGIEVAGMVLGMAVIAVLVRREVHAAAKEAEPHDGSLSARLRSRRRGSSTAAGRP